MDYRIISVRENPTYLARAVDYIAARWGIGYSVYNDCISHSLDTSSPLPRWYLLEKGDGEIVGCFGLITNDFNSRQDLWPWIAALYVEETERGQGLGGMMLAHGVREAKCLGFGTVYLATDHMGYYEKYGWKYMGTCYGPKDKSRLYAWGESAMDIFGVLRSAGNKEEAISMGAYMRNQFPYLGIKTPKRRQLSRAFLQGKDKAKVNWGFVFKCWAQPEREFQYLALDYLARLKEALTPAHIPNLYQLICTKSWWDTVDGLDIIVGDIAARYPEVNDILLKWSVDHNIWLRRVAIDHQLTRKEKTDTDLLERIIINNFGQKEFFITKAIGWSLRNYSKTNPDWVRGFVDKYRAQMAPLSLREATKYI